MVDKVDTRKVSSFLSVVKKQPQRERERDGDKGGGGSERRH